MKVFRHNLHSLLTLGLLALPHIAGASGFVPLSSKLPESVVNNPGMDGFLNGAFVLSIGVAAMLAVLMIGIGGFEYMGSEAYSSKERAKERIRSAIFGLGIILASVLILNTINPNLTNLNPLRNAIPPTPVAPGASTGATPGLAERCAGEGAGSAECAALNDAATNEDTSIEEFTNAEGVNPVDQCASLGKVYVGVRPGSNMVQCKNP